MGKKALLELFFVFILFSFPAFQTKGKPKHKRRKAFKMLLNFWPKLHFSW